MSLKREWLNVEVDGEHVTLYAAKLERGEEPLPAVVVIQEIFGPDEHIQSLVDRLAYAGYYAVAPDLFAEKGERPAVFAPERVEEAKKILDLIPPTAWQDIEEVKKIVAQQPQEAAETFEAMMTQRSKFQHYMNLLKATVSHLTEDNRRVAAMGFCMGGALTARLAAAEPRLSGAVVYYGRLPEAHEVGEVACPVIGFFAGKDEPITSGVPAYEDAMEAAGNSFTPHVYEWAEHGFLNDTRRSYDAEASRDAWVETLKFFREVLA